MTLNTLEDAVHFDDEAEAKAAAWLAQRDYDPRHQARSFHALTDYDARAWVVASFRRHECSLEGYL